MNQKIEVNSLEFEALMNLDKTIRMAIAIPSTGEFLVGAIHALDAVRKKEGLPIPEAIPASFESGESPSGVSELARSLISRVMKS